MIDLISFSDSDLVVGVDSRLEHLFFCFPGVPFTRVYASDRDDPTTPNAQLNYSLISQIPNRHNKPLFQINAETGEISATAEGDGVRSHVQT